MINLLTIEHVLPQTVSDGSEWKTMARSRRA